MTQDCPFCYPELARAQLIHSYMHWNLFLQSAKKRHETKQAAGFLSLRRHVERPTDVYSEEWAEIRQIVADASGRLCQAAGVTYIGQETVGFNQGPHAG